MYDINNFDKLLLLEPKGIHLFQYISDIVLFWTCFLPFSRKITLLVSKLTEKIL